MINSCEHCIFSDKIGKQQIGCKLNKIVPFGRDIKIVDRHYEFDGYCGFSRNCYWTHANKSYFDQVQTVNEEQKVKYSVVYPYDGKKELLIQTLKSIGEYKPVNFVVCIAEELDVDLAEFHAELAPYFNNIILTQSINEHENVNDVLEEGCVKAKGDYLLFLAEGNKLDEKCLYYLNSLINDEGKTVYMVVSKDFSICFKKIFNQYSYLPSPMASLHKALINNPKYKETVIEWFPK